MRDPKRIKPLLEAIEKLWMTMPDSRLGQLISNLTPPGKDIFFIEDDWLKEQIEDSPYLYGGIKKQSREG